MDSQKFWNRVSVVLGVGGYFPICIGGWFHPSELNVATYGIWLALNTIIFVTAYVKKFAGWQMPMAWAVGEAMTLIFAFSRGGFTFNLGPSEAIALYGIAISLSLWAAVGQTTKKWNPRILFLGMVATDMLSFYPQIKQYLLPHDPATIWLSLGWVMFILGAAANVLFVEEFLKKFYVRDKQNALLALEESILSIENIILLFATLVLMQ